jgi:hypothetical protein
MAQCLNVDIKAQLRYPKTRLVCNLRFFCVSPAVPAFLLERSRQTEQQNTSLALRSLLRLGMATDILAVCKGCVKLFNTFVRAHLWALGYRF